MSQLDKDIISAEFTLVFECEDVEAALFTKIICPQLF